MGKKKRERDALQVVDARSGTIFFEKVMGGAVIEWLYSSSSFLRTFVRNVLSRVPFFSKMWGWYNDLSITKKKIGPFCKKYRIKESEFKNSIASFHSFNDFFVRRLRASKRPIDQHSRSIVAPADARYTFFENISRKMPFTIKDQYFDLTSFLRSEAEGEYYEGGVMILARLCPIDCHRYFFPLAGSVIEGPIEIPGYLYSVNPLATSRFPWIFWENKRIKTVVETKQGVRYAMVEIGATGCGTVIQTFHTAARLQKGQEKGYFKLGGSAIVLLFPKGTITLDHRLVELQRRHGSEVYCEYGSKIGTVERTN